MCLRVRPVGAQPAARQLGVRLIEHQKDRGGSVARSRLLEDETIDRPDLLVAVPVAGRGGFGMVFALVRVRGRVRVHESLPVRVTLVSRRVDRVMCVSVWCGRQPVEACQHRHSGATAAEHGGSIVSGAYCPCQAGTPGAPTIMRPCPASPVCPFPRSVLASPQRPLAADAGASSDAPRLRFWRPSRVSSSRRSSLRMR